MVLALVRIKFKELEVSFIRYGHNVVVSVLFRLNKTKIGIGRGVVGFTGHDIMRVQVELYEFICIHQNSVFTSNELQSTICLV